MTISTEKSLLLKITHFFHVKNKEALVFFSSFNELWKHGCLKMIFFYIESVYYHISFSSLSINHSFALTLSLFLSLLRKEQYFRSITKFNIHSPENGSSYIHNTTSRQFTFPPIFHNHGFNSMINVDTNYFWRLLFSKELSVTLATH